MNDLYTLEFTQYLYLLLKQSKPWRCRCGCRVLVQPFDQQLKKDPSHGTNQLFIGWIRGHSKNLHTHQPSMAWIVHPCPKVYIFSSCQHGGLRRYSITLHNWKGLISYSMCKTKLLKLGSSIFMIIAHMQKQVIRTAQCISVAFSLPLVKVLKWQKYKKLLGLNILRYIMVLRGLVLLCSSNSSADFKNLL